MPLCWTCTLVYNLKTQSFAPCLDQNQVTSIFILFYFFKQQMHFYFFISNNILPHLRDVDFFFGDKLAKVAQTQICDEAGWRVLDTLVTALVWTWGRGSFNAAYCLCFFEDIGSRPPRSSVWASLFSGCTFQKKMKCHFRRISSRQAEGYFKCIHMFICKSKLVRNPHCCM